MTNYNLNLIDTKYALMEAFLFQADKAVLDISYEINEEKIVIQVVLLQGSTVAQEKIDSLIKKLPGFEVVIKELHLTKQQFNENKGEWRPKYYQWLEYLLFSKADIS